MYEKLFFGSSGGTYEFARYLRLNMTESEKILWKKLRNRKLKNRKFRRQHPIGDYIVDFYCLEKGLVIEVDGEIHLDNEQMKYDKIRTAYLEELNLKVIRFSNQEIKEQLDFVIKRIMDELDR